LSSWVSGCTPRGSRDEARRFGAAVLLVEVVRDERYRPAEDLPSSDAEAAGDPPLGALVRDIQVRGVHVHHYLPGIALLTLAGAAGVPGSERVGVHLSGIPLWHGLGEELTCHTGPSQVDPDEGRQGHDDTDRHRP
jgi:hypothetical protein